MYYYPLSAYLRETFGEKLYKLALDGGMTCPIGTGPAGPGAVFFAARAAQGNSPSRGTPGRLPIPKGVLEQIACAKRRIAGKTSAKRFIAYFQSYTNTYAPTAFLEALFSAAISHPEVAALSIATRPDCIDAEKAALLKRLNQKEAGMGGAWPANHPRTKRRLYPPGLCIARILSRPGAARRAAYRRPYDPGPSRGKPCRYDGIHPLRSGKRCKRDQAAAAARPPRNRSRPGIPPGKVPVMTLPEYADLVTDLLEYLPPGMVVHRLTGDGPKRLLRAPLWSGKKKKVLNTIQRELYRRISGRAGSIPPSPDGGRGKLPAKSMICA